MLKEYIALLEEINAILDGPDWYSRYLELTAASDRIWPRLSQREREVALTHADALYQARISRCR